MTTTRLTLYAVTLDGSGWLKKFDEKSPTWTQDFKEAKLFRTPAPARGLVTKMSRLEGQALRPVLAVLDILQVRVFDEKERVDRFLLKKKKADEEHNAICGALSEGDWNDEDNLPVKCTSLKGHSGRHEGGCRGGTLSWE